MKRIVLALAVVAMAGCSKGEEKAAPATTMTAAPETTKAMMADTSHMMMADTSKKAMMKDTTKGAATKTPTTIPPTKKKKG